MDSDVKEIGTGLRAARERLGLTLERAEADTRIRARYLAALEEQRFEDLPGDAYARGFLRSYASYLQLDGQRYLSLYRAIIREEKPPLAASSRPRRRGVRGPALAAGGLAAAAAVVLGAWKLEDRSSPAAPASSPTPRAGPLDRAVTRPATGPTGATEPAPRTPAVLVLRTEGGPSWLDVRVGGPAGKRAWWGTLQEGRMLRLGLGKPLHIRAGAPGRLRATIAGSRRPVPARAVDLVVTEEGIRPAR